jgi:deoxyribose-phosphate aldolase
MTNQLKLKQLLKLLDLTRLTDDDDAAAMQSWLQQHVRADALPAAFCVYPQFLPQTIKALQPHKTVALATVVNFPSGLSASDDVVAEIQSALAQGANEIDCVLPYRALLAGECGTVKNFLYDIRQACGEAVLKVIIESGELSTAQQIIKATELVIDCGADFVKSSTGKVPVGITTEAARIMLTVIAAANRPVGFKASGGVRTIAQALEIVQMYEAITGQLAQPERIRIGASALYQEILTELAQLK